MGLVAGPIVDPVGGIGGVVGVGIGGRRSRRRRLRIRNRAAIGLGHEQRLDVGPGPEVPLVARAPPGTPDVVPHDLHPQARLRVEEQVEDAVPLLFGEGT